MSNLNDFVYANKLENFKAKVIEPQKKRIADAETIMSNPNYPWANEATRKSGQAKLVSLKDWLNFYEDIYNEGVRFCTQHENLTNKVVKWYERWRTDVSNEGKQERELMSEQADILNEVFSEMYSELKVLNLDIKPPVALNLK